MIANAQIMKNVNGGSAKLIVAMEDAKAKKTAGHAAVTVVAQAMKNASTQEFASLTVAMENVMVVKTASLVGTAAVKKTKIAPLALQGLIQEAASTGAVMESRIGMKTAKPAQKMLHAQKARTVTMVIV